MKKLCYLCGNEGFKDIGQGQYLCYREVCVHRYEATMLGDARKRRCYICGKVGEGYQAIGQGMYKCRGERCHWAVITGIMKKENAYVEGQPEPANPIDIKKLANPYPKVMEPNKTEVLIDLLKRGTYTVEQLVIETDLTLDSVKGMLGSVWSTGLIKMGHKVVKIVEGGVEKYRIGE